MESKKLSLHHLHKFPENERPNSKFPTILALHGRWSHEQGLIGLAPHLPQSLLWVSLRRLFEMRFKSFEWIQITQIGKPDPMKLADALRRIDHFMMSSFDEESLKTISAWMDKQLQ